MALLLGPAGVGLMGLYSSVYELTRNLAGLGINNSGVRQIAEAVGSEDAGRISRTVITLRRVAFFTGVLGAALLLVFCRQISRFTFGDELHVGAFALLALAVFFGDVSAGQAALVQGMRRIADLARINVLGACFGTVLSIPIIYFYRQRGVVPSLVAVAGMSILTSWWYARKVKVERVRLPLRQLVQEASALLRLGLVFMTTGLMTMGVAYLVRIILVRQMDLQAAGFYQAAWNLGGVYFGFILQAMGADFYPRLTAVAQDNNECNRLVNEQAEVGLLLAVPGVLGTLALAPLVIQIFYSREFGQSVEILRWICLGMVLRVASWPMGFILLAKGAGRVFFVTELIGNALQLALIWIGINLWHLPGTGIAFCLFYIIYTLGIYFVVRRVSGFRWTGANSRLALLFVPVIAAVFLAWYVLPPSFAAGFGLLAAVTVGFYCLRTLCTLIPVNRLPRAVLALLKLFRITPGV